MEKAGVSEAAHAELIAEQLRHTMDLLRADLNALRQEQQHDIELCLHRLNQLEEARRDHESRIRSLTDGVTAFKVWTGLANGSSGLMAIAAFVKSWLGG